MYRSHTAYRLAEHRFEVTYFLIFGFFFLALLNYMIMSEIEKVKGKIQKLARREIIKKSLLTKAEFICIIVLDE